MMKFSSKIIFTYLAFLRSMAAERRLHRTIATMTTTAVNTKATIATTLTATVTMVTGNSDGAAGSLSATRKEVMSIYAVI